MAELSARGLIELIQEWPVKSMALRRECAKKDICPECGGDLDTGWECLDCNFDARDLAYPESERQIDRKWGSK